jgi:hypothetical protein
MCAHTPSPASTHTPRSASAHCSVVLLDTQSTRAQPRPHTRTHTHTHHRTHRYRYLLLSYQPIKHRPLGHDPVAALSRTMQHLRRQRADMAAFLSIWFHGAPFEAIRRDNVKDLVAYAFWCARGGRCVRRRRQRAARRQRHVPRSLPPPTHAHVSRHCPCITRSRAPPAHARACSRRAAGTRRLPRWQRRAAAGCWSSRWLT